MSETLNSSTSTTSETTTIPTLNVPGDEECKSGSGSGNRNVLNMKKKKKIKLILVDDDVSHKYNIYTNEEYLAAQREAEQFEMSEAAVHYRNIFCLKECSNICGEKTIIDAYEKLQPYIENSLSDILEHNKRRLCV